MHHYLYMYAIPFLMDIMILWDTCMRFFFWRIVCIILIQNYGAGLIIRITLCLRVNLWSINIYLSIYLPMYLGILDNTKDYKTDYGKTLLNAAGIGDENSWVSSYYLKRIRLTLWVTLIFPLWYNLICLNRERKKLLKQTIPEFLTASTWSYCITHKIVRWTEWR